MCVFTFVVVFSVSTIIQRTIWGSNGTYIIPLTFSTARECVVKSAAYMELFVFCFVFCVSVPFVNEMTAIVLIVAHRGYLQQAPLSGRWWVQALAWPQPLEPAWNGLPDGPGKMLLVRTEDQNHCSKWSFMYSTSIYKTRIVATRMHLSPKGNSLFL